MGGTYRKFKPLADYHWLYALHIFSSFLYCVSHKYTSEKGQPLALLHHTWLTAVSTHWLGRCIRLIQNRVAFLLPIYEHLTKWV